ncbi:hypothetical protein KIL84_005825 [Mauremys mutica]|uniref:Uncharacterized protein n=1 Tax=Mauremys mutica TaxID=74926 RepID=A0A9D4B4C2_9SAUR|nr:hypothetical protein KIL84_005825 [Mauremys mutica]
MGQQQQAQGWGVDSSSGLTGGAWLAGRSAPLQAWQALTRSLGLSSGSADGCRGGWGHSHSSCPVLQACLKPSSETRGYTRPWCPVPDGLPAFQGAH